ncbi:MAG: AzlC family ABC transporter permease [Actinomycetota bacterium]|nr:AzlC family ABC transporter permease [Actinomycetota bacterium]MDQ2956555.1 AzlC family ABC transporter permease [Actinomycetota bacterium]
MAEQEQPETTDLAERRQTIRDSLGVGMAVGGYGVAFGAASVAAGFSPAQTSVSSLLTFTGGTQFAIAGVIAGGGTAAAALGSGYLLGARNTFYALRLSPMLDLRGWRRPLAALMTIDETTAMTLGQRNPKLARLAFWWTAGSLYLLWNLSTLAGAVGARALGDPRRFGLDAAIPVAFLALLIPQLKASRMVPDRLNSGRLKSNGRGLHALLAKLAALRSGNPGVPVAVLAALIAIALIPLTPPGVPVLAAGLALILTVTRRTRSVRRPTADKTVPRVDNRRPEPAGEPVESPPSGGSSPCNGKETGR